MVWGGIIIHWKNKALNYWRQEFNRVELAIPAPPIPNSGGSLSIEPHSVGGECRHFGPHIFAQPINADCIHWGYLKRNKRMT